MAEAQAKSRLCSAILNGALFFNHAVIKILEQIQICFPGEVCLACSECRPRGRASCFHNGLPVLLPLVQRRRLPPGLGWDGVASVLPSHDLHSGQRDRLTGPGSALAPSCPASLLWPPFLPLSQSPRAFLYLPYSERTIQRPPHLCRRPGLCSSSSHTRQHSSLTLTRTFIHS